LLVALLIVGYIGIWTLFGIVVYFGGWMLQQIVQQSGWLETNAWILGTGIVTLAGLYKSAPLKYKCLEKCRSPLSFVMKHWRGSHERSQALRLGMHHGLFCVGCCWSMMLVMFVVGAGNLGWMLVLGAAMAVEKNAPWGRRISAPLGAFLIGCGLILGAASALWSFDEPAYNHTHSGTDKSASEAEHSMNPLISGPEGSR
jgi:predicted metal-binding membrane protein